jgi:hypothetical protein
LGLQSASSSGNHAAMVLRRLGIAPSRRANACVACDNCPDLLELEDGDFAVIGADATEALAAHLPADAGCGPGERIVRVPRGVLLAARADLAALR